MGLQLECVRSGRTGENYYSKIVMPCLIRSWVSSYGRLNSKDWVGYPAYRHWGFAVVFRDSDFSMLLRMGRDYLNNSYHLVSVYYMTATLYFI